MVSIVLRTYNEERYLDELLSSIHNQTNKNFEVILVDSGSTDNTINIAKKYKCKIVKIKKEKFSFGYSLNKGIEKAKGDYCLFISGHCIPVKDSWLSEMVKPFTNKNVGIVYGRQVGRDSTKFSERMLFNTWFPNKSVPMQKHPFCNNANCVIRKELWDKYKYDKDLLGLEDVVFADHMLKNTEKYLYYNAKAIVYHIHDETYPQVMNRYEREGMTFSTLYPQEKFTLGQFIKLAGLNIFSDLKNLWKSEEFKFKIKNISSIFRFRINQFWGTYKGYKYNDKVKHLRKRFYYPN